MRAAAVVLAAGAGRRLGGPKALLELGGTSFLARVVEAARQAGAGAIVVVVGHGAEAVEKALPAADDLVLVRNPEPDRGQLSSLKLGLRAASELAAEVDGVLVWPVDHPLVRPATARHLLDEAERHPGRAIVPRFEGRGGHPTFFPRTLFAALLALPEEAGARGLYERQPEAVLHVEVEDPGVRHDVDTPEDYARARGAPTGET